MPVTTTTYPSIGAPLWAFLQGLGHNNALGNGELSGQPPQYNQVEASGRNSGIAYVGDQQTIPQLQETAVVAAPNQRADAIRSAFDDIRNGNGGPAPAMNAVTDNPLLLAQDEKMRQLGQLRETLAAMNPTERRPEPVRISESARTGAQGAGGYQADRNARLAILNEQERNRVPTTAGKDATINLDTLPEQLKAIYTQRAANDSKRDALVMDSGLPMVARTEADKAAKRAEYEAAGKVVPAVYRGLASPEKVAADKQRRAQDESYRQGNWSMQEQARGLSQKLGINPLLATAMVSGRMAQGPAVGSDNEPRMPDSWEPRLRNDPNSQGMQSSIMDAAMFGPQGAAMLNAERVRSQGMNERARLAADTTTANLQTTGQQTMEQLAARAAATMEQLKAQGANAQQLAVVQNQFNQQMQQMTNQFNQEQQAREFANREKMGQQSFDQQVQGKFIDKQLNPSLPLDVQLEGQQIAAERERLSGMGASAPPDQLRRLQMREQALQQRIGGKPFQQTQWPSSLRIAPDINAQLDKLLMGPDSPEMVEWGPDEWDVWHPQRVKPNLERAAALLAEQNGMPVEQARNYAGEWLQNRRDSSLLPFNIYPSRENVGF